MAECRISVIMATYKRKDVVVKSLEMLKRQTLDVSSFEVIVVDDGSKDGTSEVVNEFIIDNEGLLKIKYVEHDKNRGPGAANNTGARMAESDILLFLADDIFSEPELVEAHLQFHDKYPQNNKAVVGHLQESSAMPQTYFQRAWDPYKNAKLDKKSVLGKLDFWISNLSIKKGFFLEYGVFVEYPGPAMEDLELSHRLFESGLELKYCKEAVGHHYHPQTIEGVIKRAYSTGYNIHVVENLIQDVHLQKFAKIRSDKLDYFTNFKYLVRDTIRLLMFNKVTLDFIFVPLIREAESISILRPFIGFLTARATGYALKKGVSDSRNARRSLYE